MSTIEIPEELDRIDIITIEDINQLYKEPKSPYYKKEKHKKPYNKVNYPELSDDIDKAELIYFELKRRGKVIWGDRVTERFFQAAYLGIGEGTIANDIKKRNKQIIEISESDKKKEKNFVCKMRINPLLKNLGYSQKHYKYNEALHMGSDNTINPNCRPDYRVLLSETKRGINENEKKYLNTAKILIEAKYELGDENGKWYGQAVTYARRLCASYILLANRYKLWIYYSDDNFITSVIIFENDWKEIDNDKEVLKELKELIGKHCFRYDKEKRCYVRM